MAPPPYRRSAESRALSRSFSRARSRHRPGDNSGKSF